MILWGDFLASRIGLEAELILDLKGIIDIVGNLISFDEDVLKSISNLNKYELVLFLARLEAKLSYIFKQALKKLSFHEYKKDLIKNIDTKPLDPVDEAVLILLKKLLENKEFIKIIHGSIEKYGNEIWSIPIVSHIFVRLLPRIKPDIVLTNPPWLKLSELPDSRWGEKVREYIKKIIKKYREEIPGISRVGMSGDISALFLKNILVILDKEGSIGIVMPAEQSYKPKSPHGAGKLLTYAVISEYDIAGSAVYVGDAFKHGRHATVLLLSVRK